MQRAKLRPLQQQVKQTEDEMATVSQALDALQEQLGDSDLYAAEQKDALAALLKREGKLKVRAQQLDDIWLEQQQADVVCIQETKAHKDQLDLDLFKEAGYHTYWYSAEKKGYSSVAIFSKNEPSR